MGNRQHWQDWLTGIVGVWLVISPWVLNYASGGAMSVAGTGTSAVTVNFVLSGLVAIVFAGAALTSYRMWEEWIEAILGLWLIVSPWVLHFTTSRPAFWSAIISGLVILVSAAWNLIEERQAGHA